MKLTAPLSRAVQRWLARLSREVVGAHTQALLVRTAQGLFAVAPEDQGVGRHLRRAGAHGAQELADLLPRLGAQSRVLVVGAHVGTLVVPLARHCREVVAVEPQPDNLALLKINLRLNDVSNCRVLEVAADERAGELQLLCNRVNSGGSKRVPLHADSAYLHDQPAVVSVPAARLDDLLPGEHFDAVLMDIEGSEVFALRGMPLLLARCDCLVVEFLPHHLARVAGVGVAELLAAVPPHLRVLFVPSTQTRVARDGAAALLQAMFDRGQGDDGIVFTRT